MVIGDSKEKGLAIWTALLKEAVGLHWDVGRI
jgi:hypothetical protein